MSTILNKIVPNRKVEIRIIKNPGPSPVLGNTYVGKTHTLNIATASRLVKHGYAEFVDEKDNNPLSQKDDTGTAKKTTAPADDEDGNGEAEHMTLEDAIKSLNPDDDAHWTKQGLPDLNVLKELTGEAVKRAEVDDVAPDYTRETAAEIKEG